MFSPRLLSLRLSQNVIHLGSALSKRGASLRALSSQVGEDVSIVEPAPPPAPTLLTQSDVHEPMVFDASHLDLWNINPNITPIREVWIENMCTPNSIKLGILPLNPKIFSVFPRPDFIQMNHRWQLLYKYVDYECLKTRAELSGSSKKPWPQKGTGRARQASRRAPQWVQGGWATGPRGPRPFFYMLPWDTRVNGLISTLASKMAQNDLFVVDSFDSFPSDGTADHLEELCEARGWGPSVLFVDKIDSLDESAYQDAVLYKAMQSIQHINFLPVHGLNVFAMLKHETLVLTLPAIEQIQNRLLFQLRRIDLKNVIRRYKPDPIYKF